MLHARSLSQRFGEEATFLFLTRRKRMLMKALELELNWSLIHRVVHMVWSEPGSSKPG